MKNINTIIETILTGATTTKDIAPFKDRIKKKKKVLKRLKRLLKQTEEE